MIGELGPLLRSLGRRRSAFALVVLEMASGFTIISCLLAASGWYLEVEGVSSGLDESDLIRVELHRAALLEDAEAALVAAEQRWQADEALLAGLPGVMAVAPVSAHMLDGTWGFPSGFELPDAPSAPRMYGWAIHTTPAAVAVLGLRLLEGPTGAAERVQAGDALLTSCLRQRMFPPGRAALGAKLLPEDGRPLRVRGVVADVYMRIPLVQHASCVAFRFDPLLDERRRQFLLRASPGQREAVLAAARQALGPSAAGALITVEPFDSSKGLHVSLVRALLVVLGIIVVTVILLALLGALAVSSFLVAERTRQIGVRRALGATRGDVIRYFLLENAVATVLGTVLGLGLTLALFLLMQKIFIGIRLSLWSLLITAGLLGLDGLLAALVPALRAARIPPSVASRAA